MSTNENAEMELLLTIEQKKQELAKAQEAHANYLKRANEMRKIDEYQAKVRLYADQMLESLPTTEQTVIYIIHEKNHEDKTIKIVGYETTLEKTHQVVKVLYSLSNKHKLKKNYEIQYRPVSNYDTIFHLCSLSIPIEEP